MVRYGFNIRTKTGQRVDNILILAASSIDAERRLRQMYTQCEIIERREQKVRGPQRSDGTRGHRSRASMQPLGDSTRPARNKSLAGVRVRHRDGRGPCREASTHARLNVLAARSQRAGERAGAS